MQSSSCFIFFSQLCASFLTQGGSASPPSHAHISCPPFISILALPWVSQTVAWGSSCPGSWLKISSALRETWRYWGGGPHPSPPSHLLSACQGEGCCSRGSRRQQRVLLVQEKMGNRGLIMLDKQDECFISARRLVASSLLCSPCVAQQLGFHTSLLHLLSACACRASMGNSSP